VSGKQQNGKNATCHNCGVKGHISRDCDKPRNNDAKPAPRGERFREQSNVHNYHAGCVVNNFAPPVPVQAAMAAPAPVLPAVANPACADARVVAAGEDVVDLGDDIPAQDVMPEFSIADVYISSDRKAWIVQREWCCQLALVLTMLSAITIAWFFVGVHTFSGSIPVVNNATFDQYDFKPDLNITTDFGLGGLNSAISDFLQGLSPRNPVNQASVHALQVGQSPADSVSSTLGLVLLALLTNVVSIIAYVVFSRRPDYIHFKRIGSVYTERKWLNDKRSVTFKTVPIDSPDYEPNAKYLAYRLDESVNGIRSSKRVIISYEMFVALSSFTNSARYSSVEAMKTALTDTVSFGRTCKHVNINRELDAKYDIIFMTCRLFVANLNSVRFGGEGLNCLRL
jgi:hypothetical protein